MNLKHDEAVNRICPILSTPAQYVRCLASRCMWWTFTMDGMERENHPDARRALEHPEDLTEEALAEANLTLTQLQNDGFRPTRYPNGWWERPVPEGERQGECSRAVIVEQE